MELSAVVLLVFLALFIGWLALVLGATWWQVREEARAADEARGRDRGR